MFLLQKGNVGNVSFFFHSKRSKSDLVGQAVTLNGEVTQLTAAMQNATEMRQKAAKRHV